MKTQTTTNSSTSAEAPQTKVCVECHLPKHIEEFYKDATSAGGRRTECKACHINKVMSHRATKDVKSAARAFTDALQGRWRNALDAIATPLCDKCSGEMALVNAGTGQLCKCVYLKIFDDIMAAYEQARASAGCRGEITEHHVPGFSGGVTYSRKNQEFVADVEILVKRVARQLDEESVFPHHQSLARHVILDGGVLPAVLRSIGLGVTGSPQARAAMNVIALRAAVAAVEMEPYPIFPVHKYFDETPINTMTGEPSYRKDLRIALQRDSAAKSAAKYDQRSYH